MTIKITDKSSHYVLDGGLWECQHENTEVVPVDFGRFSIEHEDVIDDWRDADVCTSCNLIIGDEYGKF